ncbi:MAG TPA: hypothetical protein VE573_02940 [Nitrososphaeraceae archaeon]|jgi:hypothetical protein|nr:hypothetical protein [Nitrososphaeraceae archaeon]
MALGELIADSTGKITGQRVLDVEIPKMETSFAMEGNYRGIPCTDVGTYTSVLREGGVLYGEGQGIITTKDGQGMATWTGQGIGKFTAPGKVSFRGSIFLRTPSTSQGGKLSSLNNMVGVFEYEVDEMGSCFTKSWEWK